MTHGGALSAIVWLAMMMPQKGRVHGFVPWVGPTTTTSTTNRVVSSNRPFSLFLEAKKRKKNTNININDMEDIDEEEGSSTSSPAWIERCLPMDMGEEEGEEGDEEENISSSASPSSRPVQQIQEVYDYNLGVSGFAFETGPLSRRFFDAIMSKNQFDDNMSKDMEQSLAVIAMEYTAKEATKAALKQNGLEMAIDDEDDDDMWGMVDTIQLLTDFTNDPIGTPFDSCEEAVKKQWTPGTPFSFVVRVVPARTRDIGLEELLEAMDPDGSLREEAKAKNIDIPTEEITTLEQLTKDGKRRAEMSPPRNPKVDDANDATAFAGLDQRGYRPIFRRDLSVDKLNGDGTEDQTCLMHVMDALATHSALVVDLTDGGTNFDLAQKMSSIWDTSDALFAEKGGPQLLETRWSQSSDSSNSASLLLPKEMEGILDPGSTVALKDSFDMVCEVGKDVVRIATAASSEAAYGFIEDTFVSMNDAPSEDDEAANAVQASKAALRMVNEVIDDGKPLEVRMDDDDESTISASSHRFCQYTAATDKTDTKQQSELFGATTEASFVTCVPVASTSSFEVFDADTEHWYRPELAARKHWEKERKAKGKDSSALVESIPGEEGTEIELPWHARYIVILPGDLMQLTCRDEILSAVQRVVVPVREGEPSRRSAPILLRGRPGTKMDVKRYLGNIDGPLLSEVDGKSMHEIHNAMQ